MKGGEHIVQLRLQGSKPKAIWVSTDLPRLPDYLYGERGHVLIQPSERVALLDLRFVIGCLVHVDGKDPARVREVAQACIAAKASRVITATFDGEWDGRLIEMTDTQGDWTWRE